MLQFVSAAPGALPAVPPSSVPSCRHEGAQEFFPPRSTLFLQGYADDRPYRLIEGCVALSHMLPDGRRQVVDILGPGRMIGLTLAGSGHCAAETLSYVRVEPVREIGAPDMEAALRETVARAQGLVLLLGRKTAQERVATAILDLAERFARPAKGRRRDVVCFHLHPTRGDLADWLGLTVETVSRCFTRLKRAELIAFQQPEIVTLLKPEALAHIAAGGSLAETI